jgi:hypothetical protein
VIGARTRRLVAALVLVLTLIVPAARAAPAAAADPVFALLAQPAWTPVGGDVTLRLDIPAGLLPPDEAVQLRMRMHTPVTTTAAFVRTIDGERLGFRIDTRTVPVSALPRDAQGAATLTFGLVGSAAPLTLAVRNPGVYPLELALRTDETIASFVTWIVVADPATAPAEVDPVRVASVWNVATAPIRDAEGNAAPDALDELAPGGRLDEIARLLDEAGTMPLSLQVGPETLEAWDALAQADSRLGTGVARVKEAAARPSTQLLRAPYVPIDLTSLEAAGLGSDYADQLRTGANVVEGLTGVTPDARTAFVDPVDTAALARLRGLLVDRVVLRAPAVADIDAEDTLTPFAIASGDGTLRAAATSPQYEDFLTGDVSPALRAQRLLAAMSVLAFEREETAGVVLAAPARWAPDLTAERAVITGLNGHPYLRSVTLDDLFASVPAATNDEAPVVRNLAPHDPAPFPTTAARYNRARTDLAALRSSIGAEDPRVLRGDHALRLALSTDNSPAQAAADLGVVDAALNELQQGVSTTGRRVTVTARKADIPLSFVNEMGKPVGVRVQLASEKLLFPQGADRVLLLPEGTTTERFTVEARASGTFTMTVTLTTADGAVRIGAPERVSVRSGVFGGAGAALTAGALLFLALWWGNHFRRTRRARRAAATP